MFTFIKSCCEILILFIISIPNLEAVYDYDSGSCFFEDWSLGECKPVLECPELLNQLKDGKRPAIVSCGFEGAIQIACCNISSLDETSSSSIPDLPTKMKVTSRAEEKCEEYIRTMPGSVATQIIGGTEAGLGEFPHMVALGYVDGMEIEFDCGGTLISDRYVVTAAHCVVLKGRDPPTLGRVGIVDLNGNYDKKDTDFYIESIFPHPEYKSYRYYHDIALLKFDRPVVFNSLIFTACLNNNSEDPSSLMHVTGWGSTSLDKISKSQHLKKGSVSSVSIVTCNVTMTRVKEFKLPVGLIQGQICAMDKNFIMDTCGGDSGGPLQIPYADSYLYKLIGVTSFGKACSGGIPAVYTRVSSYLGWIEDIVWPIDS